MGKRLKEVRKLLGMSREEFARRLGVSVHTLDKWESGRRRISLEACKKLLSDFGVNLNWLIGGKGKPFEEIKMSEEGELIKLLMSLEREKKKILFEIIRHLSS